MRQFPNPSTVEIQECLLRFLFGYERSFLTSAVRLAYSDLSRTLHGIAAHDPKGHLREAATSLLEGAIRTVVSTATGQESFDRWHQATCHDLRQTYRAAAFGGFCFGHAQKWVNMAIKYSALLGDRAVQGGHNLFRFGHVPIDSLVVSAFSRTEFSLPAPLRIESWSRLDSYDTYMAFQHWVRDTFAGSAPLAVEFVIWQEEATRNAGAT